MQNFWITLCITHIFGQMAFANQNIADTTDYLEQIQKNDHIIVFDMQTATEEDERIALLLVESLGDQAEHILQSAYDLSDHEDGIFEYDYLSHNWSKADHINYLTMQNDLNKYLRSASIATIAVTALLHHADPPSLVIKGMFLAGGVLLSATALHSIYMHQKASPSLSP